MWGQGMAVRFGFGFVRFGTREPNPNPRTESESLAFFLENKFLNQCCCTDKNLDTEKNVFFVKCKPPILIVQHLQKAAKPGLYLLQEQP